MSQIEKKIVKFENHLQKNLTDYQCLTTLMVLYKENNLIFKLNLIREYTSKLYPLSEDMWLEWISDDFQKISMEEFDKIFHFQEFYLRSISDFLCPLN